MSRVYKGMSAVLFGLGCSRG